MSLQSIKFLVRIFSNSKLIPVIAAFYKNRSILLHYNQVKELCEDIYLHTGGILLVAYKVSEFA